MFRIAITGGIACGKSSVASIVSDAGIPVCEADDLAHKEIVKGSEAYREILSEFGDYVVAEDGEIDRRKLGAVVFGNPSKLAVLNRIVHPGVKRKWNNWLTETGDSETYPGAAVVIPLLYEIEEQDNWDIVICVAASKAIQIKRLKERDISGNDAEVRIRSQLGVAKKMGLADYVIVNEATREVLKTQAQRILENMLGR